MNRRGSSRRSRVSIVRRTTNQYWVDYIGLATGVTSVAPIAFNVLSNLATDYNEKTKGATVMSVKGSAFAAATNGAVTTDAILIAGLVVADNLAAGSPANLDPTLTAGHVRPWMWQACWAKVNTVADASALTQYIQEQHRVVDARVRRIIASNDESLWFAAGVSGAATQSFNLRWHVRSLIRIP